MGIATALVNSWESGEIEPDEFQRRILSDLLGFHMQTAN
jgi:ribosome-binding protein aMBF1 (putative translation factor)